MDRPCKHNDNLKEQRECDKFSDDHRADGKILCFFYRYIAGDHWCNGMYENKEEEDDD